MTSGSSFSTVDGDDDLRFTVDSPAPLRCARAETDSEDAVAMSSHAASEAAAAGTAGGPEQGNGSTAADLLKSAISPLARTPSPPLARPPSPPHPRCLGSTKSEGHVVLFDPGTVELDGDGCQVKEREACELLCLAVLVPKETKLENILPAVDGSGKWYRLLKRMRKLEQHA